jgi:hypothetical protein
MKWLLPTGWKSLYATGLPKIKRGWMDANGGHAYKCPPLNMANGFGWEILNPVSFTAKWSGAESYHGAIEFKFRPDNQDEENFVNSNQISSHFGNGIITFSSLNFIFRTSKGDNLFIKAPTNHFKHGAHALEAMVETDWLPYTFTINWKLMQPGMEVEFVKGEPLACVFPYPRGYIESFSAVEAKGRADCEFQKQHLSWANKRNQMKKEKNHNHGWYIRGLAKAEENVVFDEHQKLVRAKDFQVAEGEYD